MFAMPPEATMPDEVRSEVDAVIGEIYDHCVEVAPNFGVDRDCLAASLEKTVSRFIYSTNDGKASPEEVRDFMEQLQCDDLFLALACANGNERAWWEFDQQHRSYLERVARHLAKTETDAQDVIDQVYVDLYGTKIVDGERVSKFATYSGRGSLRGWLRTVIWHSLVDLHRASHDEVSLDEMTENLGEGMAHASFLDPAPGGEHEMIDHLARERYRRATVESLEAAFSSLEDHEKLLLLYYHVENLKLREIAKLVENEASPLRGWFQRRKQQGSEKSRTHESTVMRWLEKSYAKVLAGFKAELTRSHDLSGKELDICMQLATEDLAGSDVFRKLSAT